MSRVKGTPEEELLDALFERALEAASLGCDPSFLDLADVPADAEMQAVIRLAREVAVVRPHQIPSFSGFELLHPLGQGGMGQVYLAREESLHRLVAIKVLPSASVLTRHARDRFLHEARSLARLRHPNVVAVYGVLESDDTSAYTMEFVDGCTLAEVVSKLSGCPRSDSLEAAWRCLGSGNDPPDGTLMLYLVRLGLRIARALGEVHRQGIVHRDVKPSNILIRRDGTPLLSDFGVARDPEAEFQTQVGTFVGTPAYAAPEQLRGDSRLVDARSDVYALGCTLFHALTGQPPFRAASPATILRELELRGTPYLRSAWSGFPRDLEAVIARAMEPDVGARYATADALADDLQRVLHLQPVGARSIGPGLRVAKWVRRNRLAVIGAACASLLVLFLAIGVGRVLLERVREEARRPTIIARELREARLALLNRYYGWHVFAVVYGVEEDPSPRLEASRVSMALNHYAEVVELAPEERRFSRERDTVCLAACLVGAKPEGIELEPLLRRIGGETARQARHWRQRRCFDLGREELERLPLEDRRTLGLLAFLCRDPDLCSRAWKPLCDTRAPDPLIAASLGQLYLALDLPQLALPLLRDAWQVFGDAGVLLVDLAEAAMRCGDLPAAESALRRARSAPHPAPAEGRERVEARLHAMRGELEAAASLYSDLLKRHTGPTLRFEYALFLELQGLRAEALEILTALAASYPHVAKFSETLARQAEQWWQTMDDDARFDVLLGCLGSRTARGHSFLFLAETLLACRGLSPGRPVSVDPGLDLADHLLRAGSGDFFSDSQTSGGLSRSSGGHGPALIAVIQNMELDPMNIELRTRYSSTLKRLQARIWLSPFPRFGSAVLKALHRFRRKPRVAPAAVALLASAPLVAQVPTAGWTSIYNGPNNDSRAFGQVLMPGWQKMWSAPSAGGRDVLVSGQRLVFRGNPNDSSEYTSVNLVNGTLQWSYDAQEPARADQGACIVGDRLFIPRSSWGSGASPLYQQKVECVDLDTGAHIWTWASGGNPGGTSWLQSVPWVPSMGTPQTGRVVFSLYDQVSCAWDTSVVSLDAEAPMGVNPLLAQSTPTSQRLATGVPTVVFAGSANPGWTVYQHRGRPKPIGNSCTHKSWRIDTFDLDLAPSITIPLSDSTVKTTVFGSPRSPVVTGPAGVLGFTYDTGGFLVAVDLLQSTELWSAPVPGVTVSQTISMVPYLLSDRVVLVDGAQDLAWAWDFSGNQLWGSGVALPATALEATVMDGDILMMPFDNGEVWGLDPDGSLLGPFHTEPTGIVGVKAVGGFYLVSTPTELVCYRATNATLVRGTRRRPTSIAAAFSSPADAGKAYIGALSFGPGPGIPLGDGRSWPLAADELFSASMSLGPPSFVGFGGVLDAKGGASAEARYLPFVPGGAPNVYASFLVLDPASPVGVLAIAPATSLP